MEAKVGHPAKYTDDFMSVFADLLSGKERVLDPFAGTGKIGVIKKFGFDGDVYANEIEPEWIKPNTYNCDFITVQDAEFLQYPAEYFDAICTSPTYGNRMADHHIAKDGSKRNTYTHCIGRQLSCGNTGKMQWGFDYREKHKRIYNHLASLVRNGGVFICNVKNHIRKGKEVDVKAFHELAIIESGFVKVKEIFVETKGNGFGANSDKRTSGEYILGFQKAEVNK